MTREDLAAQLGALALVLFPDGMDAHDLSLEDLEAAKLRTLAIFREAEQQIIRDVQLTADDVADDIFQVRLDEVGRD